MLNLVKTKELLQEYYLHNATFKEGKVIKLVPVYKPIYDQQYEVASCLNGIEISRLIGLKGVVDKVLEKEYALLSKESEKLKLLMDSAPQNLKALLQPLKKFLDIDFKVSYTQDMKYISHRTKISANIRCEECGDFNSSKYIDEQWKCKKCL